MAGDFGTGCCRRGWRRWRRGRTGVGARSRTGPCSRWSSCGVGARSWRLARLERRPWGGWRAAARGGWARGWPSTPWVGSAAATASCWAPWRSGWVRRRGLWPARRRRAAGGHVCGRASPDRWEPARRDPLRLRARAACPRSCWRPAPWRRRRNGGRRHRDRLSPVAGSPSASGLGPPSWHCPTSSSRTTCGAGRCLWEVPWSWPSSPGSASGRCSPAGRTSRKRRLLRWRPPVAEPEPEAEAEPPPPVLPEVLVVNGEIVPRHAAPRRVDRVAGVAGAGGPDGRLRLRDVVSERAVIGRGRHAGPAGTAIWSPGTAS